MSAATNSPTEPINPDPPRDAPATLTRLGRVLNVVRRLIGIGQQLIATVHERAAAPDFRFFAKPFGTTDIALIIARITGGLRRAAALEAMLCERAQRGRDLTQAAFRDPATPTPRAETERAPPDPQPETRPRPALDPRLANLPTEAEIAADIRRRPSPSPAERGRAGWGSIAAPGNRMNGAGGTQQPWVWHVRKDFTTEAEREGHGGPRRTQ
jgi:hypothetical protein